MQFLCGATRYKTNYQESYITRSDQQEQKEGHVLFKDTLKTFYLRFCGVGHMVKAHSDNEIEEIRCLHSMGYSFWLAERGQQKQI